MSYDDFKKRICHELSTIVADSVTVEPKEVNKNNGIELDAIIVHSKKEHISPCSIDDDTIKILEEDTRNEE